MARSLRIEYPGAFYHVMARGNRREAIFLDDDDRRTFVKTLGEASERCGWRVHAWVLMGNHYHLLLETPEANLVAGMSWVQNTYTRRFNVRHGQWGRLFGDRYKSVLVDDGDSEYYQTLMDYIHLNPARARLIKVRKDESVREFAWSSISAGYAVAASKRPDWLAVAQGLEAFGLPDTVAGRRRFVERLDERARTEGRQAGFVERVNGMDGRLSHLRHGWYWGGQAFAERMGRIAEGMRINKAYASRAYRHTLQEGETKRLDAESLLAKGLNAAGLISGELATLKGSDPRKVAIAVRLWREGGVSQKWISDHLSMKSAANVSQCLSRVDEKRLAERIPKRLLRYAGLREGSLR